MSLRCWLAFLVLGLPLTTHAAFVTWVFEGTVEGTYAYGPPDVPVEVPELTSLGVAAGTPFVAKFTVDLDTPDSDGATDWGQYDEAMLRVTFVAASYSAEWVSGSNSYSSMYIQPAEQLLQVYTGSGNCPCTYFSSPNFVLPLQGLDTTDVFATDVLPDPFPAVSSLEPFQYPAQPDLGWGYGSYIVIPSETSFLMGSLSAQYTTVPEPFAATLLGVSSLALAVLSRRRSW